MDTELEYFRTSDRTIFFDAGTVPQAGDGFGYFTYNSSIHELLVESVSEDSGCERYAVTVTGDPEYPGKNATLKRNGEFINYRGVNYRLKRF